MNITVFLFSLLSAIIVFAIAAGVIGTPGNFIVNEDGDTWFIPGAYPYEQITAYIDEALQ